MGTTDKLTPKQEKFLLALMTSKTIDEATQKAGIARTTGYNYMKSLTFRRAYRKARTDIVQQTTALLQSASIEAVEVLREIMLDKSVSPYARQQSAQTVLTMAYKAHEVENVLEVVEELEARFDEPSD
ncbi:replication protein [Streptococcus merionis]|uniref:replication protein n=1 Tax=Streptococcus merionis TaxID=400065 RepID=UPI0026EA87D5|nr:replication protein [Streptococcus merionis]